MDIIHLLPDSVANQIAAGEVIQRPASCIKELVENSLDAGAENIDVLLSDAGRTMIQVIDDGKGMSETDARMAFERHATSKISSADDLFSLRTMGFRGEALASVCAVAQVELLTRRAEDETGTRLEIHGSEVMMQEPCQCAVGTNMKVKNLFYNVPARRRFLKTDATELRNIVNELYRIVLVNPQCHFTLTHNGELLMDLPAGNLKHRIEQVFGKSINKQFTAGLVEIKSDTDIVSIRGFVGKEDSAGRMAHQYFFVNNRFMRHPYFHKAVLTAYQGMLAADQQPPYFIYFDVRPEAIDVNIHPTKTEIKFADEQAIWQILLATVREALGKFNVVSSIDFEAGSPVEIPVGNVDASSVSMPEKSFDPSYNPFAMQDSYRPQWEHRAETRQSVNGWEQLYGDVLPRASETPSSEGVEDEVEHALFVSDLSEQKHYQVAGRYILLDTGSGLLVIDRHRAHVCVLFNELQTSLHDHKGVTQQLLFPEPVDLTAEEQQLLSEAHDDLAYLGFDISRLSPSAYMINGIPACLTDENAVAALRHLLTVVGEAGLSARDTWRERMCLSIAEDTAVVNGKTVGEEEVRDLLKRLFALSSHARTPDGKKVMSILPVRDLEKLLI